MPTLTRAVNGRNFGVIKTRIIMDIRIAINLLTASVFIIIGLLATVIFHTLSTATTEPEAETAIVAWCGTGSYASEFGGQYSAGKKVWNANGCGACHAKSMAQDATGPALGGVTERWADYPREDLYAWIRNSGKLVASGHPRAVELIAKWKTPMAANPSMTDEEIEAVLAYIEEKYE